MKSSNSAAFDEDALLKSACDLDGGRYLALTDAVDALGCVMFGEVWAARDWRGSYSESERISGSERFQRQVKHLQQVHHFGMSMIKGIDSLNEWELLVNSTPETLAKYEEERRAFLADSLPPRSAQPIKPPSWPPPVTHPELTAEEKAAIRAECADERHPDETAQYGRVVAVTSKLRQWLRAGRIPACIGRPRPDLKQGLRVRPPLERVDVPADLWTAELATIDVFRSGQMSLALDSRGDRAAIPASDSAPAGARQRYALLVDAQKFIAVLRAEIDAAKA